MADDRIDPSEQTPEADLLEQHTPLDPHPVTGLVSPIPETPADNDADEADRLEQHATVPGDYEDDYPHDPAQQAWS